MAAVAPVREEPAVEEAEAITVYVPKDPTIIGRGAGVVGTRAGKWNPILPTDGDLVTVDYETNEFGAGNIVTYADRVYHAADRHTRKFPTSKRMSIPADLLTDVGTYADGKVTLKRAGYPIVADWLGIAQDDLAAQLEVTHGG